MPKYTLQHVFYSNDADLYVRNGSGLSNSITMYYSGGKLVAKVNNVEVEVGEGVPIGTVIAWVSTTNPTKGGTWLECNGQSCASYPELVALLGKNTVPDMRNRFLEGHNTPNVIIESGLPEIYGSISEIGHISGIQYGFELNGTDFQGSFSLDKEFQHYTVVPRFRPYGYGDISADKGELSETTYTYKAGQERITEGAPLYGNIFCYPKMDFRASNYNSIYGKSDIVQPPAHTVRYFIKAA